MIIFSVEKSDRAVLDNIRATIEASSILESYAVLDGYYQGTFEVSFITNNIELGRQLVRDFEQDCYLERGHYGYWYLIDTKTDKILDTFKTIKEVTKDVALKSEYYSILDGKYYLASKY